MLKFEKPIIKKASEMERGDIIRVEYGIAGNYCTFVFEICNDYNSGRCTETHFHRINDNKSDTMYEFENISKVTYEVIGKEEP